MINKFGILNTTIDANTRYSGIPHPGLYVIDETLIVKKKQFEESYAARPSAESVLAAHFDKDINKHVQRFRTPYLAGSIAISDSLTYPAQILTLVVKLSLQEGFHLYVTPIPEGFTPLTMDLQANPNFALDALQIPNSEQVRVETLDETFNVVSNQITLKSLIRVSSTPDLGPQTLTFQLKFQACDDKVCMTPEQLNFQFPVAIPKAID